MRDGKPSDRLWILGSLGLALLAVLARVSSETGSIAWGILAAGGCVGILAALASLLRLRAERKAEAALASGRFVVEAGLLFDCLPDPWPTMARETLNPAGADRAQSLPVCLFTDGANLRIEKKRSWSAGRTPFSAEVRLSAIEAVSPAPARGQLVGSGLRVTLKNGTELDFDLAVGRDSAAKLAARLEAEVMGDWGEATGLVVTSDRPPLRTSPARAGGLLMICFVPFGLAMVGFPGAPAAGITGTLLFFYCLWLQMRRPVTMHRRLAVGLVIVAGAFALDAAITGQVVRLGGSAVGAVLAQWLRGMKASSYGESF